MYVCQVSILYKSIAGRYRPVRVADGPITARYRFIKNVCVRACARVRATHTLLNDHFNHLQMYASTRYHIKQITQSCLHSAVTLLGKTSPHK